MKKKLKAFISVSTLSLTLGLTTVSGILPNTIQQVEAASRGGEHRGTAHYFPRCSTSYTSIVDVLKSIGYPSSYSYRKQIAALNGISNYTGKASQNIAMLNLLKAGRLTCYVITCR